MYLTQYLFKSTSFVCLLSYLPTCLFVYLSCCLAVFMYVIIGNIQNSILEVAAHRFYGGLPWKSKALPFGTLKDFLVHVPTTCCDLSLYAIQVT